MPGSVSARVRGGSGRDRRLHVAGRERSGGPRRSVERGQVADDVAGAAHPEHDLAPSRRNARDDHLAALDHEHAVGEIALREQRLAAVGLHTPTRLAQCFGERSATLRQRGHRQSVADACDARR